MPELLDQRLFERICVYQDVVVRGQVVLPGKRDCQARFQLLEKSLPCQGAILDIGSNLGWFAMRIAERFPGTVIASVESDRHSAAAQKAILSANGVHRVCLLTRRAGVPMCQRYIAAGQQFAAALCLSVLHWIPEPGQFVQALGQITERLFVEFPHPKEEQAGSAASLAELVDPELFLRRSLPEHHIELLGKTSSHLYPNELRPLFMAYKTAQSVPNRAGNGLMVSSLLQESVAWPPRSWWQRQLESAAAASIPAPAATVRAPAAQESICFTSTGLAWEPGDCDKNQTLPTPSSFGMLSASHIRRLPEGQLSSWPQRWVELKDRAARWAARYGFQKPAMRPVRSAA